MCLTDKLKKLHLTQQKMYKFVFYLDSDEVIF